MDNKKRCLNENPKLKANFISKLFFCWISPLLALGQKKTLEEEDLFRPVPNEETDYLTNKLEKAWMKELKSQRPNLFRAIIRVWIGKTLRIGFLPLLEEIIRLIQPLLIRSLIRYFNGQIELKWAILYASLICLNTLATIFTIHPCFDTLFRHGMERRLAVGGLIYRKIFKLNHVTESSGKILNMLSNDVSRIENMLLFAPYLVASPLQAIGTIILLLKLVDLSILSGALIVLLLIPIQSVLGKVDNVFRHKTSKIADKRISLTSEILNGIKIVKMYCWEKPFMKIISAMRRKELGAHAILFVSSAIERSIDMSWSGLITFTSVAVFINIVNKPLLSSSFVLIMAYNIRLSGSLTYNFTRAFKRLVDGHVSCKRIQDFLLKPEISKDQSRVTNDGEKCVIADGLCASWNEKKTLDNISIEVKQNSLLAVVGQVGCGKTSLLMALLGEMPSTKGEIKISGSVFYVSQEPWIFSSTIKQNVLFGKEYSREKFNEIMKLCALDEDLKTLENAENTIIGDKGVNLSGGQRARISLARALYHDPDIYLFDDPLSAVDSSVAKHLYENCINGYLKSKTRILVTHQVHLLTDADEIIVLDNGRIQDKGKYEELMKSDKCNFMSLIKRSENNSERVKNDSTTLNINYIDDVDSLKSASSQSLSKISMAESEHHPEVNKKQEHEEKRAVGTISCRVYKVLFLDFGVFSFLVLCLLILAPATLTASNYWLSYWATAEEEVFNKNENMRTLYESCMRHNATVCGNETQFVDAPHFNRVFERRKTYFTRYTLLFCTSIVIVLVRSFAFYALSLLIAKKLHKNMLNCVIQTKMRFFDLNPIGRIMNRFSKDIGNIDDSLPLTLFDFLHCTSIILSAIVLAAVINYWIIVPLIPLIIIFAYLRKYFINVSLELKRIEGTCRSPIYIHTSNTIAGISTIRACNNQNILIREYSAHSDYHTQAYVALITANRWFAVRLELIVVIYSALVIFICILAKDNLHLTPSQVGLVLVSGLQMMNYFQWTVRLSAEVENLMTSLERIIEYSTLEGEENANKSKIENDWPTEGNIEFDNMSFSYDNNSLPPVLKNITLKINSREKVAIVGRTGSGKSSLLQALYRMAEPSGRIVIDGVNIKDVSLSDLRSKMSIIPQEPTLFMGTIRYNLDPFGLNDDATLWKTLEIVQLKGTVKGMNGGLDSEIENGGSNLSVGQKQLFCLARAVLKKSKILLIDEATANVDYKTDAIVQRAIREYFNECTVITIAHRLQTIIDSDKIICMSNGELADYGPPNELLQDRNSVLYNLVAKLGKNERRRLRERAEEQKNSFVTQSENDNNESENEPLLTAKKL